MIHDIHRRLGSQGVRFPVYEYLILFLPVAAIILVVGFSFASSQTENRIEAVLSDDKSRLLQISGFVAAQVSGSLNHLLALTTESVTTRAFDSPDAVSLQSLEASFVTLARRNPYYQQIRWIDEDGQERVRVSREQGGPRVVPAQGLQNKAHRYYFTAVRELLPGEIYISPVDLNVEHGQIEVPYKPVLRIAVPVFSSQREPRGAVVMNIAMRHIFDAVENLRQKGPDVQYMLINHEGQVLNRQNPNPTGITSDDGGVDFAASHPAIWRDIQPKNLGRVEAGDGLWTWSSLTPGEIFRMLKQVFPQSSFKVDRLVSDQFQLTLVAHRPVGFLLEVRRDSRMLASLGALLTVLVYGFSMFFYLSGHVRARRAELNTGFAVARAEQLERIKSLEERFQRLFEVSSVGQLVVDGDGHIELANAAAEQLLGYGTGKLKGLSVDTLLPDGQRSHHRQLRNQYMESPEGRKMGEGRNLEALKGDGTRIPVEIGLNPYVDNGRPLVLVSIIDLSPRNAAMNAFDEGSLPAGSPDWETPEW